MFCFVRGFSLIHAGYAWKDIKKTKTKQKINRDVLRLVTSVAQGKHSEYPWDSTVSEVYYEVHITRVLHTAWISNVDSVMFVNRIRDGNFCPKLVTRRKTSFSICLPTKKFNISLILFQNKRCSCPHANLLGYYNWQLLWKQPPESQKLLCNNFLLLTGLVEQ